MTIATQVGTAIEFAHRHGVIHRDIKPANILIAGDEGVAKVVDFGLAALSEKSIQPDFLSSVGNAAHTGVGYCVGTPAYMSPEQALGQRSDTRSDIFSFGILLYELFTGTQPFYGDNLASLFYQIVNRPVEPPSKTDITLKAVDDIVMGCLEKEPTRRWQNMEYVVEQLKSITPEFQSTRWLKPAAQVGAGTNHVPESEGIKAPGRLRIDDVHVEEEKHIKTCLIDFRVSNGGGSDVVINRIRFTAVNVASVPVAGLMELTETYSLDISQLEKAGDIAEIPVAQIVPPGRSDRFGVRLTAVHVTAGGVFRGWNLRPTLVSNFGPVEGPVVEIWLPYRYGKYTVATAKEIEELYEAMRSAHQAGDREEFRRLEHAQRLLLGLEKKQ